jgi:hypothetical protein
MDAKLILMQSEGIKLRRLGVFIKFLLVLNQYLSLSCSPLNFFEFKMFFCKNLFLKVVSIMFREQQRRIAGVKLLPSNYIASFQKNALKLSV